MAPKGLPDILRATGAQGLARRGVDLWAIQLLGRWGSDAVRSYVREVALERATTWAPAAPPHPVDIEQVLAELRPVEPNDLEARVSGLVRSLLDAFKASVMPALRDEVQRDRLALAAPAPSTPGPASGPRVHAEGYLVNNTSQVVHRFTACTDGPVSEWATACGWRFASRSNAAVCTFFPANSRKTLCEKCLPDLKESGKASLESHARATKAQFGDTPS